MLENWSSLLWNWGAKGHVKGSLFNWKAFREKLLSVPSGLYLGLTCLHLFTISVSLFLFFPPESKGYEWGGPTQFCAHALLPGHGDSAVTGLCLTRTRPRNPGHRRHGEALPARILMISLLTQLSSLWAKNQTPHSSAKLPRWIYLLLSLNPHFSPWHAYWRGMASPWSYRDTSRSWIKCLTLHPLYPQVHFAERLHSHILASLSSRVSLFSATSSLSPGPWRPLLVLKHNQMLLARWVRPSELK